MSNDASTLFPPHQSMEMSLSIVNNAFSQMDISAYSTMDAFLALYPTSAKHWQMAIQHALNMNDAERAESLFLASLPTLPSIPLWTQYLEYLAQKPSSTPEDVHKAYERAISTIGTDHASGPLYQAYAASIASMEAPTAWEEQRKVALLRGVYRRAVQVPTVSTETLWREYDAFENNVSKMAAKKFTSEVSSGYMAARVAAREMKQIVDAANAISGREYPGLQRKKRGAWTAHDIAVIAAWRKYVDWEKSDPLRIQDSNPNVLHARVTYAYHLAINIATRYVPEMWFDAALFQSETGKAEEAKSLLRRGLEANPESFLLASALAELEERERAFDAVRELWEAFIGRMEETYKAWSAEFDARIADIKDPASLQASGDDSGMIQAMDGDTREKFREIERKIQRQREEVMTEKSQNLVSLTNIMTLAWIHFMWHMRRTEGITSSRKIFSRARRVEAGMVGWEMYVASAWMEYHGSKSSAVAIKILEAGLKEFGTRGAYVNAYVQFLIHINDDTNMRALFERTIGAVDPKEARSVWATFVSYEAAHGDLVAVDDACRRLAEAFPEEPDVERYSTRCSFLDLSPKAFGEIAAIHRISDQPTLAGGTVINGGGLPTLGEHGGDQEPSPVYVGKLDLTSVTPSVFPRPDLETWKEYDAAHLRSAMRPQTPPPDVYALLPPGPPIPESVIGMLAKLPQPARFVPDEKLNIDALLQVIINHVGIVAKANETRSHTSSSVYPEPIRRSDYRPSPPLDRRYHSHGHDRRREFDSGPGDRYRDDASRPTKRAFREDDYRGYR